MIVLPAHATMMARYSQWQNANLIDAARTLDEAALWQARGAFFGSILGTFSHLLWADLLWLSRFEGGPRPEGSISDSAQLFSDWSGHCKHRQAADRRMLDWADGLTPEALSGELTWHSAVLGRDITQPTGLCVAHFFNHQTHHRGQIHAMLTSAGARPGDTDLVLMPKWFQT